MKHLIESKMEDGELDEALKLLQQYEERCPEDADILSLYTNYYLLCGQAEKAKKYALQGVKRLPLNGDMYYNLAYTEEILQEWLEAYVNYQKAGVLYRQYEDEKVNTLMISESADRVLREFEAETKCLTDKDKIVERMTSMSKLIEISENAFGFLESAFRSYDQIVGRYYYEDLATRRFVGIFKDQIQGHHETGNMDVIHVKAEFLKVSEAQNIKVRTLLEDEKVNEDIEYLVPIASSKDNTVHIFRQNQNEYPIIQYDKNHFNYYRTKSSAEIYSNNLCYYGKPIPMYMDEKKKKLVLSIFVDGLAQAILNGEDFEKNMPNTYRFFQKGAVCKRAYNAGEWTYPSIANYVTGLDTVHHMLFHNELDCAMSKDVSTLPEYFQQEGYYTASIGGNWRIIPTYGHARGYDRYIYQHQKVGFKVHEVIADAIDHIRAFEETNQYVWISVGDLHDIADGDDLPTVVQKTMSLSTREYEDKGATSAKQSYSANKTSAYIAEAKHIDWWLGILFSFIEENYKDEEIIISLFSDHGQGYMVKEGAHFLSKERSNVPIMFRGGAATGMGAIDEIVSSKDYSAIMRKLGGIEQKEVPVDGWLPESFGGTERKYALTESLHPGDPYQAVIFAKEETFFFVNPEAVGNDGRFLLGEYTCWIENEGGKRNDDNEACEKYLKMVLKHIAPILIYE